VPTEAPHPGGERGTSAGIIGGLASFEEGTFKSVFHKKGDYSYGAGKHVRAVLQADEER